MNPTARRRRIARLSTLPMVKWSRAVKRISTSDAMELSDAAAHMAVHLARFSAYLSRMRVTGGKHDDAVKSQNRTARAVRQALGFTYKDDAITF